MKEWHFNVLFWVGVGGAIFILVAPAFHLDAIPKNPTAVTGVGAILTYVLTQKRHIVKKEDNGGGSKDKEDKEEAGGHKR